MSLELQRPPVTDREAEVLALLDRHMTNAQIAEWLFISVRTVESHVSSMLRKLGVPDRRSLARSTATTETGIPEPTACRSQRFDLDPVGFGLDAELTNELVHRSCCAAEAHACADGATAPRVRSASVGRRRRQRRLARDQQRGVLARSHWRSLRLSDPGPLP